ncbi:MAG: family 16 glycosylhydrolase [Dysgonamonadaceae bacterium]|jgi:beta-glucanase (GH16 family)|nr:family 16 glycosylhydrolase [Dysgonamonadaceae bacterium]
MKKLITNILLAAAFSVSAQTEVLLDNFESGDQGWQPVDAGWVDYEIVNNPSPDLINSSAKVMKIVRKPGTQTWAGIILRNKMELTFGALVEQYRYAHIKVLKSTDGKIAFKLEKNGDSGSFTGSQDYAPNGNWQEIVFDMGAAAGKNYDDFFIMPDQTANIAEEITVYIDDIAFQTDPNGITPGETELPGTFQLVWADEFDGAGYDRSIWSPQISGGGFGNHELQYYTGNANNIFTRDGKLVLKAIKENYQNHAYTSGKLWTQQFKNFTYGRVEARFKLPKGRGTWPAIWMMPTQSAYGGWPNSGEIDVMEFVGYDANRIYGTVHRGAGSGGNGDGNNTSIAGKTDDYHTIRIDWEPGYIKWYLNGQLFHTYTNGYAGTAQWPFDKDFYVILNFAVGGDWGGAQGVDESIWPQEFLIDYVRVYQKSTETALKNAGNEVFTISSLNSGELEIKASSYPFNIDIYSVSGQKQLSQQVNVENTKIDISSLSLGVYVISISDGNEVHSQKIIK